MTKSPFYTLIDHTADLGMCVRGDTLEKLFENAGNALFEQMVRVKQVSKEKSLTVSVSATDLSDLMVKWLSEILYLFNGENLVIENIKVDFIQKQLINSILTVTQLNIDKHELIREIKAVTYHQIEVTNKDNLWIARIIFDL